MKAQSTHVGMSWDFGIPGEVKVTVEGLRVDLLIWANNTGTKQYPAAQHLFDTHDAAKLSVQDAKRFHSGVDELLHLSKRVLPDIILLLSFLTNRIQSPDIDDMKKLIHVFQYLNNTREMGICLRSSRELFFLLSSMRHGVPANGKGHSGMTISLGLGPPLVEWNKQKIVTKSSTESELVALSHMCSPAIWSREFLLAKGEMLPPVTLYQDNRSTISLSSSGQSNSDRTRHVKIRHYWVKDHEDGDIKIVYMPTQDTVADIITKPLQGAKFLRLHQLLTNRVWWTPMIQWRVMFEIS